MFPQSRIGIINPSTRRFWRKIVSKRFRDVSIVTVYVFYRGRVYMLINLFKAFETHINTSESGVFWRKKCFRRFHIFPKVNNNKS